MTLNTSLEEIMNAMGAQAAIAARELGKQRPSKKIMHLLPPRRFARAN